MILVPISATEPAPPPGFMEGLLSIFRVHWDHEPATDRSADSPVREFGEGTPIA